MSREYSLFGGEAAPATLGSQKGGFTIFFLPCVPATVALHWGKESGTKRPWEMGKEHQSGVWKCWEKVKCVGASLFLTHQSSYRDCAKPVGD